MNKAEFMLRALMNSARQAPSAHINTQFDNKVQMSEEVIVWVKLKYDLRTGLKSIDTFIYQLELKDDTWGMMVTVSIGNFSHRAWYDWEVEDWLSCGDFCGDNLEDILSRFLTEGCFVYKRDFLQE